MGNKFYTPEIEEFHVGFEFEEYDGVEGWKKRSVDAYEISSFFHFANSYPELLRVKHLDREDLESLGWNQTDYDTFRLGILEVYLEFNPEYKTFIYESKYAPNVKETLFKGTIKNKSELAKLMKMLNIQ